MKFISEYAAASLNEGARVVSFYARKQHLASAFIKLMVLFFVCMFVLKGRFVHGCSLHESVYAH